ncbi:guanylyl cyclase 1 [Raphanus sativus]|uniref:Guanylyl cyclase 1 n=1 Tax=Raphanus sativus TaxID=3726 RepID=A0A6J0KDH3_RAPSA|nr:guanylyl cyclase 1 [Raphanus sativus]XP_018445988.1 guanylyl cyclase 1 [Raphanus sativus]XP_056846668.1 guanylyl cyclase 1 [Raphanus sativus]KAJ4883404.1 guanylyl cyclase 1 [Raphanus sativus]
MWPLCFLLNKILKVQERNQGRSEEEEHDGDSISPKYSPFVTTTSHGKNLNAPPSSSHMEVPHVHQLASWDCGLACVLMVLRATGITTCSIQDLADICSTNSIWTVDLAYLLQRFCVEFSYCTITFGANPNYSIEEFYKEQLPEDLLRVDLLFRKAHESGVIIQCRSVSIHEISCLLLSGNYIAIALVDQDKLSKSWLEEVFAAGLHNSNSSYTGHYIVICGYDAVKNEFEIRDPASSKVHERISSRCLENARKSFGTDEDLLLINLENIKKQKE